MIHTSSFSYRCHSKKSQVQTNIFLVFIRTCCYNIYEDINFFSIIKRTAIAAAAIRTKHTSDKLNVRKHTCSLTQKFKLSLFIPFWHCFGSLFPQRQAKTKTTKWRFRWKSIHVWTFIFVCFGIAFPTEWQK